MQLDLADSIHEQTQIQSSNQSSYIVGVIAVIDASLNTCTLWRSNLDNSEDFILQLLVDDRMIKYSQF